MPVFIFATCGQMGFRHDVPPVRFLIGKRSADNARRFMMDVANRLVFPKPHTSDDQSYTKPGYTPITQISTDGMRWGFSASNTLLRHYQAANPPVVTYTFGAIYPRHQSYPHVQRIRRFIKHFVCADDGPTAVEYAVIIGMVFLACIGAVNSVGQAVSSSLQKSADDIGNATGGSGESADAGNGKGKGDGGGNGKGKGKGTGN